MHKQQEASSYEEKLAIIKDTDCTATHTLYVPQAWFQLSTTDRGYEGNFISIGHRPILRRIHIYMINRKHTSFQYIFQRGVLGFDCVHNPDAGRPALLQLDLDLTRVCCLTCCSKEQDLH